MSTVLYPSMTEPHRTFASVAENSRGEAVLYKLRHQHLQDLRGLRQECLWLISNYKTGNNKPESPLSGTRLVEFVAVIDKLVTRIRALHHVSYEPALLQPLLSLEASIIKVVLPVRDRLHEKWKCAAANQNSSGGGVGGAYCVPVAPVHHAAHRVEEVPAAGAVAETGTTKQATLAQTIKLHKPIPLHGPGPALFLASSSTSSLSRGLLRAGIPVSESIGINANHFPSLNIVGGVVVEPKLGVKIEGLVRNSSNVFNTSTGGTGSGTGTNGSASSTSKVSATQSKDNDNNSTSSVSADTRWAIEVTLGNTVHTKRPKPKRTPSNTKGNITSPKNLTSPINTTTSNTIPGTGTNNNYSIANYTTSVITHNNTSTITNTVHHINTNKHTKTNTNTNNTNNTTSAITRTNNTNTEAPVSPASPNHTLSRVFDEGNSSDGNTENECTYDDSSQYLMDAAMDGNISPEDWNLNDKSETSSNNGMCVVSDSGSNGVGVDRNGNSGMCVSGSESGDVEAHNAFGGVISGGYNTTSGFVPMHGHTNYTNCVSVGNSQDCGPSIGTKRTNSVLDLSIIPGADSIINGHYDVPAFIPGGTISNTSNTNISTHHIKHTSITKNSGTSATAKTTTSSNTNKYCFSDTTHTAHTTHTALPTNKTLPTSNNPSTSTDTSATLLAPTPKYNAKRALFERKLRLIVPQPRLPRTADYTCSICTSPYTVMVHDNPWYAVYKHTCVMCKGNQVPRIDISTFNNSVELDPNNCALYGDGVDSESEGEGGESSEGSGVVDTDGGDVMEV